MQILPSHLRKPWLLWSIGAALCSLAVVFGKFFTVLPIDLALAVAHGLAWSRGVAGASSPSIGERFYAWVWQLGGPGAVTFIGAIMQWIGWTIALSLLALALLLLLGNSRSKLKRALPPILLAITFAGLTTLGILNFISSRQDRMANSLSLAYPVDLIKNTKRTGPAFVSASGLDQQLLWDPSRVDLRTSAAQRSALQANPALWRQAARAENWNTVILTGIGSDFRPLLDHLMAAPDWQLAEVSNHGYIFIRGTEADIPPPKIESIKEADATATAIRLAQFAVRFDALHWNSPARTFLAQAMELAPNQPDVLANAATIAASQKRWHDALKLADKTLARSPGSVHARLIRVAALDETGRVGEAVDEAQALSESYPNDSYILFLYAKLCRKVHNYARESATLEKLVKLSEARGEKATDFRIYLGQSLAKQGLGKPAREQLQKALDSGELPPAAAEQVRSSIEAIDSQTPKQSP